MTEPAEPTSQEPLLRAIGPMQMTLYAAGSMMGAGIYGLIGKAAGQVGNAVWASFFVAMVVALLTALSYASLGSRYPRAGGRASSDLGDRRAPRGIPKRADGGDVADGRRLP